MWVDLIFFSGKSSVQQQKNSMSAMQGRALALYHCMQLVPDGQVQPAGAGWKGPGSLCKESGGRGCKGEGWQFLDMFVQEMCINLPIVFSH